MPYEMNPQLFNSILALSNVDRTIYFLSKAAERGQLWGAKDEESWLTSTTSDNLDFFPVWPHPEYAQKIVDKHYPGHKATEIPLHEFFSNWLPKLEEDNTKVGIFPNMEWNIESIEPSDFWNRLQTNRIEQGLKTSELTLKKLGSTETEKLSELICDYMSWREPRDIDSESLSQFTYPMQVTYSSHNAEMDILNGGFEQYFYNSYGVHSHIALDGFRVIGAPKAAELLAKAMELKKADEIKSLPQEDRTLESFSTIYTDEEMTRLGEQFGQNDEVLETLRSIYLSKNLKALGFE